MRRTTIKNLTESQIRKLRSEAFDSGDYMMGVICDLALEGEIDLDDYTVLDHDEARRVGNMTQDDAYAAIVEAINDAEGQGEYTTNSSDYWVWALGRDRKPLTSEGPWGPYDYQAARQYARIAATNGTHDRAVSVGRDPLAETFEITRVYKAGTGEHKYGVAQRIGAPMEANARWNATIEERGNGFPDVGSYVPGDDGNLYLVKRMAQQIHTGESGSGSANYVYAVIEAADWGDCEEGDEFPAQAILGE